MAENSALLPALKSSRLGVVITTVALVALASGSTGVLVAHGTKQLSHPPTHRATPQALAPARTPPVLVDRAPGSLADQPAGPAAVAPRPVAGPVAPVPVPPLVQPPVAPAVAPPVVEPPVVEPPVVEPPVVEPPVVEPPVVEPPVVEPPVVEPPVARPALSGHGHGVKAHGVTSHGKPVDPGQPPVDPAGETAHDDNGKHLGQEKHGR